LQTPVFFRDSLPRKCASPFLTTNLITIIMRVNKVKTVFFTPLGCIFGFNLDPVIEGIRFTAEPFLCVLSASAVKI